MNALDATLALAISGGRVCPQPDAWRRLYELLPDTQRQGARWEPSLPLILGAWYDSSDRQKTERFHEHLAWAESHGALARVHAFLAAPPDDDWHLAP